MRTKNPSSARSWFVRSQAHPASWWSDWLLTYGLHPFRQQEGGLIAESACSILTDSLELFSILQVAVGVHDEKAFGRNINEQTG